MVQPTTFLVKINSLPDLKDIKIWSNFFVHDQIISKPTRAQLLYLVNFLSSVFWPRKDVDWTIVQRLRLLPLGYENQPHHSMD